MSAFTRLASLSDVTSGARRPDYAPADHGHGIVHLGVGAFHKAHQAVYTDAAIGAAGGDWRITGVSLRGTAAADTLNPQNGLYTLIERGAQGTTARIIGSIGHVIAAVRDQAAVIDALTDPATRIVSLTVTEKAYGIDRVAGTIDMQHPAVAADLANPQGISGILGLLTRSLALRRATGIAPYTVLCCDNLPDNGALVQTGVVDFARYIDPDLSKWIEANVAFPATMVDRITPAPSETTRADAEQFTGCIDLAAVETEAFSQWVIEDRFSAGRPNWEAGGAAFVASVAPYERMKLRMLNGTHSMLAYAGFLTGCTYVRDAMAHQHLAALVARHLQAAAATLATLDGVDIPHYADQLTERFRNPALAHETYQIAMDGTEKLPQRILRPALRALELGQSIRPFAFAVASWMRYSLGKTDAGHAYALRDPREGQIAALLTGARDAAAISAALHAISGLFPEKLINDAGWRATVSSILEAMLRDGVEAAVAIEADKACLDPQLQHAAL